MKVIGLTGGIATGKSTVASYLREMGFLVIDADQIARELTAPGQPLLQELAAVFGPEILLPDGSLDRKKLGQMVFRDRELLRKLNALTHPPIIRTVQEKVAAARREGRGTVFLDVPLLFETGMDAMVDEVWVVAVDEEAQLARLMQREGLEREEARRRIAAQMPLQEKIRRAHAVIDNSGTPAETRRQVKELVRKKGLVV